MPYTIEIATAADADGLAALHHLSHTKSFAAFASPAWVASRKLADYQSQWREFFARNTPGARAWIARAEGRVAGMVKIAPEKEPGLAQLSSMHVHPDVQGQGVGQALMKVAEGFIKEAGYERAILGVIQANQRARRLYERAGWTVLELHPVGVEGVPIAVCGKQFK